MKVIGTELAAMRGAASLRPTVAGSTANNRVTVRRVVRDVEPRAEAHLEDLAGKAGRDAGTNLASSSPRITRSITRGRTRSA